MNQIKENRECKWSQMQVKGQTGRYNYQHPNDDFEQPRALFRKVFTDKQRADLVANIVSSLKNARKSVQEK